VIKLIPLIDMC